ncbi:unnamed protein product, partial [Acidithrix sp. C25]
VTRLIRANLYQLPPSLGLATKEYLGQPLQQPDFCLHHADILAKTLGFLYISILL